MLSSVLLLICCIVGYAAVPLCSIAPISSKEHEPHALQKRAGSSGSHHAGFAHSFDLNQPPRDSENSRPASPEVNSHPHTLSSEVRSSEPRGKAVRRPRGKYNQDGTLRSKPGPKAGATKGRLPWNYNVVFAAGDKSKTGPKSGTKRKPEGEPVVPRPMHNKDGSLRRKPGPKAGYVRAMPAWNRDLRFRNGQDPYPNPRKAGARFDPATGTMRPRLKPGRKPQGPFSAGEGSSGAGPSNPGASAAATSSSTLRPE